MPRADIERFENNTVHFIDGTSEEFDTVVCGTGFYVSFPFLPDGLVEIKHGNLAMVYAGCVLPDYKNLYLIGTQQVRYGFGPLITPAAGLIAQMIGMQDRMELPIGRVMKESGAKLPDTHLVDPMAALRRMRRAKWLLPRLIRKEKKLRGKFANSAPKRKDLSLQVSSDITVY